jgi:hypothetical protein
MKIQPWKSHMMLASSPNCWMLEPSVVKYLRGNATREQNARSTPTTSARTR